MFRKKWIADGAVYCIAADRSSGRNPQRVAFNKRSAIYEWREIQVKGTRHIAMKQITTKLHVEIVTDCFNRKVIFIQFHNGTGLRMPKLNEKLKIFQYAVNYGPSKLLNKPLHTEMLVLGDLNFPAAKPSMPLLLKRCKSSAPSAIPEKYKKRGLVWSEKLRNAFSAQTCFSTWKWYGLSIKCNSEIFGRKRILRRRSALTEE